MEQKEPKGFQNYANVDGLIQKEVRGEIDIDKLLEAQREAKITKEQFDRFLVRYARSLELDSLTGFFSKRALEPTLKQILIELGQSQEAEKRKLKLMALIVIYIDLNNFKTLNDECGHLEGDKELKTFAGRLKGSSRSYDLIFRNGGDEFVVLKPIYSHEDISEKALNGIIKKTYYGVNSDLPVRLKKNGSKFKVTAAMGYIILHKGDSIDPAEELIKRVEEKMYKDKGSNGR